jgi:hypothetical protein
MHFQVGLKQYAEVRSAPSHEPPDRVAVIAFTTTDVNALRDYLKASGMAVPGSIEKDPGRSRSRHAASAR